MKKEKLHPAPNSVYRHLMRRIVIPLWSLWLLCMVLLTVGTAQYVLEEIVETSYEFPEFTGRMGNLDRNYPAEPGETRSGNMNIPGYETHSLLKAIQRTWATAEAPYLSRHPDAIFFNGIYGDTSVDINTAVLFIDNEENVLHQSGDFLYFDYSLDQKTLYQPMKTDGYAWIDLSDEEDPRYASLRAEFPNGSGTRWIWETARMTGYFVGDRFEPLFLAVTDGEVISNGADSGDMERVAWEVYFDLTDQAPADKELVTIFARYADMMRYHGRPVRYQGQRYDDLLTLAREAGYYRNPDGTNRFHQSNGRHSLFSSVFFGVHSYWDLSEYDFTSNQPWPEPVVTMVTAMQASPLLIAMKYLVTVYILTAVLVLMVVRAARRSVRDELYLPLREINRSIAEGWHRSPTMLRRPSKWDDIRELADHYRATQNRLTQSKNEIARLNTAIGYAQKAEENRRQMTSHIAHELKTPLAVIHSYTEALQERIDEEKREQYLAVILSETERMDGMVLEMLDLSRLEAGRVKLSRDEFSLLEMTKDVFARLDMALQAKELRVSYQCYYDAMVTADESRIRQVVENFATNAVKHTPAGGEIRVHIYTDREGTVFSMENDGENLPGEVLDKVWDSFWRQDESRTSPGTGLGLAIAKGIITLHGGTCAVYNTKQGVEFRFRI